MPSSQLDPSTPQETLLDPAFTSASVKTPKRKQVSCNISQQKKTKLQNGYTKTKTVSNLRSTNVSPRPISIDDDISDEVTANLNLTQEQNIDQMADTLLLLQIIRYTPPVYHFEYGQSGETGHLYRDMVGFLYIRTSRETPRLYLLQSILPLPTIEEQSPAEVTERSYDLYAEQCLRKLDLRHRTKTSLDSYCPQRKIMSQMGAEFKEYLRKKKDGSLKGLAIRKYVELLHPCHHPR